MRGLLLEQRGRVCLKVDTRSFRRYLQNSKLKFCNSVSRMGQIMSTKCAAWTRLIRLQVRRRDLCNKETDVYGTVCKWFPMRGTFRKQEESLQSVFFLTSLIIAVAITTDLVQIQAVETERRKIHILTPEYKNQTYWREMVDLEIGHIEIW